MENIPDTERTTALETFGRVAVVQPDRTENHMVKCKICGLVMAMSEYAMWKHWKISCAFNLLFKYVYPTDAADRIKVECLVCQKTFETISFNHMELHRFECKKKTLSGNITSRQVLTLQTNNIHHELPPATKAASTSQVVSNNEPPTSSNHTVSTTTTAAAAAVDLNHLQYDKFRFVLGGNKFHFGTQCRLCKEVFLMDTLKLLHHRTQCKSDNSRPSTELNEKNLESDLDDEEVLICVQTVNIPLTNAQDATQLVSTANAIGNSTIIAKDAASSKFCFVCNARCNESSVNMFGSVTAHSKKSIYDFIWKFLGNKPSVRNATTDASSLNDEVICKNCFGTISDYDVARSNAKRLKKQIRQKLIITETYFEQSQSELNATETADERDNDQQQQQTKTMDMDVNDVIDLCDDDDDDDD